MGQIQEKAVIVQIRVYLQTQFFMVLGLDWLWKMLRGLFGTRIGMSLILRSV
jgi:hypothetical protein